MEQEQDKRGHTDDNVLLVAVKVTKTHFLNMKRCRVEGNESTSEVHSHLVQLHFLRIWGELSFLATIKFI